MNDFCQHQLSFLFFPLPDGTEADTVRATCSDYDS